MSDEANGASGSQKVTSRRAFIAGGSATLGAAAFVGACDRDGEPAAASSSTEERPFDPTDWSSVQDQFELDRSYIHLAAFVLASHPRSVRIAIERYAQELDRNTYSYIGENEVALEEEARAAIGRYLGVTAQEVALTDSTTMGLALLYSGIRLGEGDEILATTHDFYSTHESMRLAAAGAGASFRKVQLFEDATKASIDEIASNVRDAISSSTRTGSHLGALQHRNEASDPRDRRRRRRCERGPG